MKIVLSLYVMSVIGFFTFTAVTDKGESTEIIINGQVQRIVLYPAQKMVVIRGIFPREIRLKSDQTLQTVCTIHRGGRCPQKMYLPTSPTEARVWENYFGE